MRHEARLAKSDEKGVTRRKALQSLLQRRAEVAARARKELAGPGRPSGFLYLWEMFLEVGRSRGASMVGLNPISYPDIDAWARLTGRAPDALEVDALFAIDAAWRDPKERED